MKPFKSQSNKMRVIALLLVTVCLCAVCIIPASAESGTCGNGLTWSFSLGTLTISGEGDMTNFNEYNTAPWYSLRDEIKKVVISEGVTSIGSLAFYNCTEIRTVLIPDTVKIIGGSAFFGCKGLEYVTISSKLSRIERQAFYGCTSLVAIDLPISLEYIGDRAFYLCESLISVTVPRYAEKIGVQAFAYCISLLRARIDAHITVLPEWTFYGCINLSELSLPETVTSIDDYALKNCDNLTAIYHSGDSDTLGDIRDDIKDTNPNFASSGYIGSGEMPDTSTSTDSEYDTNDELISQTNTTVTNGENVTVITEVVTTPSENGGNTTYFTTIKVIVNDNASWGEAARLVAASLVTVNDQYSLTKKSTGTVITVYTDESMSVGEEFLKEMAGRDAILEIVAPSGNVWRIDCTEIKPKDVTGPTDYNYTVSEAPKESSESLGTDDCYEVDFEESSSVKSEILIQLPESSKGKNAYLYQVEDDGSHTRLQASAVDNNANAHFFLSNVEKNTKYIIGLNVPGESTDDVIITSELAAVYGAIQRLEKIEYVSTGVRNINGLTLGNLMLIVIGGLVFISIIVGVVMFFIYRSKQLKRVYTKK